MANTFYAAENPSVDRFYFLGRGMLQSTWFGPRQAQHEISKAKSYAGSVADYGSFFKLGLHASTVWRTCLMTYVVAVY
ncbi:hypothetical protein BN1708_013133 [Verticillium longisporum]|uniref:Uncharacterized protein n=1 Tax=Verticillium longisporum TaxID=100787 RepID=A0A0G4LHH1_VERLO|nr:hypothetical protein BN1708_013133 [Verticillium longisporum]